MHGTRFRLLGTPRLLNLAQFSKKVELRATGGLGPGTAISISHLEMALEKNSEAGINAIVSQILETGDDGAASS